MNSPTGTDNKSKPQVHEMFFNQFIDFIKIH